MTTKKYNFYLLGGFILLAIFFGNSFIAYAKDANNLEPIVNTIKTSNGTSVTINLPQGYSGKVLTTYDGKDFKTISTPLTTEEVKKMNDQIEAQHKAIQKMFEEQAKMFDLMWKNFWL